MSVFKIITGIHPTRYKITNEVNNSKELLFIFKIVCIRDRSEITVGEGHYLCGEGHNFSNKILGGSLFFLPRLREGHNFFLS